jgi:hypothetical protein
MASSAARHRILLVREWDSQTTGSGCCGKLGGVTCELHGDDAYARTRGRMQAMGGVYRALRRELPRDSVEITVVDPRNMVWLIPSIIGDARRRGLSTGEIWREVRRGVRDGAIVVDGRTLPGDDIPEPDEAVDAVLRELAAAPER